MTDTDVCVLLVDDEDAFVDVVARRLSKRGLKVLRAFSGGQALELLAQERPGSIDVVLLDVKMPGLDGLETLKIMKDRYPELEVVVLTGHATLETVLESRIKGALDLLRKPCRMEDLMLKILEAAERKKAAARES